MVSTVAVDDGSSALGSEDEVIQLSKRKSMLKPLKVMEDVVIFRQQLYAWQLETAEAKYGAHIVSIYGSHMIMSDAMIDHVITCAKAPKLPTVQHLVKETGWWEDLANKYGNSLLTIVCQHSSNHVAPPPHSKKKVVNINGENIVPGTGGEIPSTSAATRVMHCSTCRKPNHNRMVMSHFCFFFFLDSCFKAGLRNAK